MRDPLKNLRLIDHIVDKAVDTLQFQTAISQGALYRGIGCGGKETAHRRHQLSPHPGRQVSPEAHRCILRYGFLLGNLRGGFPIVGQGRALLFRRLGRCLVQPGSGGKSFLQTGEAGVYGLRFQA